jgi:Protein of unknown function (DUF2946)
MRFRRGTRALTSWIAVLAILMSALAPTISHALGTRNAASWIEVCTTAGAKWVEPHGYAGENAPAPGDAHAFEHCPYCSLHANAVAVPAAAACWQPATSFVHEFPIAFLVAPRSLHAWVSAQPRAPPLFS